MSGIAASAIEINDPLCAYPLKVGQQPALLWSKMLSSIAWIRATPLAFLLQTPVGPAIMAGDCRESDATDLDTLNALRASILTLKKDTLIKIKGAQSVQYLAKLDALEKTDFTLITTLKNLKAELDTLDKQDPRVDTLKAELKDKSLELAKLITLVKDLHVDIDKIKLEENVKIRELVILTAVILAISLACVLIPVYCSLSPIVIPICLTTTVLPLAGWAFQLGRTVLNIYDGRKNEAWGKVKNDLLQLGLKLDDIKEGIVLEEVFALRDEFFALKNDIHHKINDLKNTVSTKSDIDNVLTTIVNLVTNSNQELKTKLAQQQKEIEELSAQNKQAQEDLAEYKRLILEHCAQPRI